MLRPPISTDLLNFDKREYNVFLPTSKEAINTRLRGVVRDNIICNIGRGVELFYILIIPLEDLYYESHCRETSAPRS